MRRTSLLLAIICVLVGSVQAAFATVRVHVDIATQTMSVEADGGTYSWPVSTGRSGFNTPQGTYRPQRMMAVAYSHKYHNSPMPHSIFFRGGYAIHGTYETGRLGRAASHGCIRLAPANAATLFSLVKAEGAVISIGGGSTGKAYAARRSGKGTRVAGHHRKSATRMAARERTYGDAQSYYSYTSQHEPAPVQQWMENPSAGY